MKVSLVSYTRGAPGTPTENLSIGETLAYVARVSNPGNQHNTKTSAKLLAYCLRKGHWSVFETCSVTLEIETSLAIAEQILRHRSFCFQKQSGRYAEFTEFEVYEARRQDETNRQNSIDDMPEADKEWFLAAQRNLQSACKSAYLEALSRNIAKEQSRFLLPTSTKTKLYVTGNIRSWITYLRTRLEDGVQQEHKDIALLCRRELATLVPEIDWGVH